MKAQLDSSAARSLTTVPADEDPAFRRFLAGDPAAIGNAARIISSIVRFRGYFIPPHERPDLEQDTLLQLWRAIVAPGCSFQNSFDGLVRAIAYRRCIDWRRQKRTSLPLEFEPHDDAEPAERRLLREEERAIGQRVLDGLRGPCRELFRLHAIEGLGYGEIAEMQGRSEMALRTQMSACLKEARAALARLRSADGRTGRPRGTAS